MENSRLQLRLLYAALAGGAPTHTDREAMRSGGDAKLDLTNMCVSDTAMAQIGGEVTVPALDTTASYAGSAHSGGAVMRSESQRTARVAEMTLMVRGTTMSVPEAAWFDRMTLTVDGQVTQFGDFLTSSDNEGLRSDRAMDTADRTRSSIFSTLHTPDAVRGNVCSVEAQRGDAVIAAGRGPECAETNGWRTAARAGFAGTQRDLAEQPRWPAAVDRCRRTLTPCRARAAVVVAICARSSSTGRYAMEAAQRKVTEKFRSIQKFLDDHAAALTHSAVAPPRKLLDDAVQQIDGFAADQLAKSTQAVQTRTLTATRVALRDHNMLQINAIALHHLPNTVNTRAEFKLPRDNVSTDTLVTAAKAMAAAAQPYSAIFIQQGRPADFIAQLQTATQAVETAVEAGRTGKRIRKGATSGIKSSVQAGRAAVKLLISAVTPALKQDPQLLAEWKMVTRGASAGGKLGHGASTTAVDPIPPVSAAASTSTPVAAAAAAPSSTSTPVSPVNSSTPASPTVTTAPAA